MTAATTNTTTGNRATLEKPQKIERDNSYNPLREQQTQNRETINTDPVRTQSYHDDKCNDEITLMLSIHSSVTHI